MTTIYHILGADIPHHNHTLLSFFQKALLPELDQQPQVFYLVSKEKVDYPALNVHQFADKKAIALATVRAAKADPNAFFILHGQYNPWIWLALFCGKLPACRTAWHIWGADLYETASGWKAELFYRFRRAVQKTLPQVWATQGDLHHFWQTIRPKSEQDRLMYFPTKLDSVIHSRDKEKSGTLTILLGNSGDRTNNHIEALTQIQRQLGANVRVILPMGYPAENEPYIQEVEQHGKRLFPVENLQILREKISFENYLTILNNCDLGYFNFERQQGIGTICLLIQLGIPFALNPKNPFIYDLHGNHVPFLLSDELNREKIAETGETLRQISLTQLGFFPEKYTQQWREMLSAQTDH